MNFSIDKSDQAAVKEVDNSVEFSFNAIIARWGKLIVYYPASSQAENLSCLGLVS